MTRGCTLTTEQGGPEDVVRWAIDADLPTTAGFDAATACVTPGDVEAAIPCGGDVDAVVEAAPVTS